MNNLVEISTLLVSTIFDHANLFLTSLSEAVSLPEAGGGITLAFALGAVAYGSIPEGVLANIRKWHGSIDEQFNNIDNLVSLVVEHQSQWSPPKTSPPPSTVSITKNLKRNCAKWNASARKSNACMQS